MKVLVTGATGYIGGRIIPRLLERGEEVTVFVRDPARIEGREWFGKVSVVEGDLLEPGSSWRGQVRGFDAAYYLVHSMYSGDKFNELDRNCAANFADAARGNIGHCIFLGGLQPRNARASGHLSSRAETGAILRSKLPTTELRAGPIIGSGSASFEMVRYLTERLPVMVAPKWILNRVQPIAVRDILSYLLAALDKEPLGIVDVGMPPLTFKEMMHRYAKVREQKRIIIPLPVLTPRLAARWVGLVTPIPNTLAVPLVEGVIKPLEADTAKAQRAFPGIQPIDYETAVRLALRKIRTDQVETAWSSALGNAPAMRLTDWEGTIREERVRHVAAPAQETFRTFASLGGERGWLTWNWAWGVRGLLDRLIGGPGLRRGRRHPHEAYPGEAIDFWRVEMVEPGKRLLLRAEMKVPGKAWLLFEARDEKGGGSRLFQTAIFFPDGFPGALYWYALYPIHKVIFSAMAREIAKEAEASYNRQSPQPSQA